MTTPVVYTGTAKYDVFTDARISDNSSVVVNINPATIPLTWSNSEGSAFGPVSKDTYTLNINSIASGYIVVYKVEYQITGYNYINCGDYIKFVILTTDTAGKDITPPEKIPTTGRCPTAYWNYNTPAKYWNVTQPVIPSRLGITIDTNMDIKNYIAKAVNMTIHFTITVVNGCSDINNIGKPLCTSFCLANPSSEQCVTNYALQCLGPNPGLGTGAIATPVCSNYYAAYIAKNRSNDNIDSALRTYCKKYKGNFGALFLPGPAGSNETQREIDVGLCACHLTSPSVPDPQGTVLYDEFYQELIGKNNAVASGELGVQDKCLVPQCRSSPFLSREIPLGGCSVPQCFNVVTFNNNGTINGNVNINQNIAGCGGAPNPNDLPLGLEGVILIILIIVVIAVLMLFAVVFGMRQKGTRMLPRSMYSYIVA